MPRHRDTTLGRRADRTGLARLLRLAALALALAVLLPTYGGIAVPDHRVGATAAASVKPSRLLRARLTIPSLGGDRTVPQSFLGLSTEYWTLPIYERDVKLFERVLSMLEVRGDGPMILRIGGDSADHTNWDPRLRPAPRWVFRLTPQWLTATGALVRQQRLRVILDMNLVTGSSTGAAAWARAALAKLPRRSIAGFEIGNEPDIYDRTLWLATLARTRAGASPLPSDLTASQYARDFRSYATRLERIDPRVPLLGPALAHPGTDVNWIADLLGAPHPGLRMISAHRYAFSACARPGARSYPTIARVLSERASAGVAQSVRGAVQLATRAGLPFRLTELNSVTCGGLAGVSNTFATALWAPDALFELLRAGVASVNLHVREYAINAPFTIARQRLEARPLLYGLALFARTLGPAARLLPVTLATKHTPSLKAWAVRLRGNVVHVLILDKTRRGAAVDLRLPGRTGAGAPATVQRLLAPSVTSTTGVTLAGQHLTGAGRWAGPRRVERVRLAGHGYEITVPARSAALVSVHATPR